MRSKMLAVFMTAALLGSVLCGCDDKKEESNNVDSNTVAVIDNTPKEPSVYDGRFSYKDTELKTVGDAVKLAESSSDIKFSERFEDNTYYCMLSGKDIAVCIDAEISDEDIKKINELDLFDPEYSKTKTGIVEPLFIAHLNNYTGYILSDEELASYEGISGDELDSKGFDIEWTQSSGEKDSVIYSNAMINYRVTFKDCGSEGIDLGADDAETVIGKLTVDKVEFEGLNQKVMG